MQASNLDSPTQAARNAELKNMQVPSHTEYSSASVKLGLSRTTHGGGYPLARLH